MSEPLFPVEEKDPGREHQACDDCLTAAWASNDGLRVRGWLVFDGESQTGQPLHVRKCPACQREGAKQMQKSGRVRRTGSPRAVPLPPPAA